MDQAESSLWAVRSHLPLHLEVEVLPTAAGKPSANAAWSRPAIHRAPDHRLSFHRLSIFIEQLPRGPPAVVGPLYEDHEDALTGGAASGELHGACNRPALEVGPAGDRSHEAGAGGLVMLLDRHRIELLYLVVGKRDDRRTRGPFAGSGGDQVVEHGLTEGIITLRRQ